MSIQIWGMACSTAIRLTGAAATAAWVLVQKRSETDKQSGKIEMSVSEEENKKEL